MTKIDIFSKRPKNNAFDKLKSTGNHIKNMTQQSIEYHISEANYSNAAPTMRFLTPFALAMNATAASLGILYTLPIFIGSTIQLGLINILQKIKDRKKTLTVLTILQHLSWIPIILLPFLAFGDLKLLLIFATINAILYSLAMPIWNSLVGDLIPTYKRGNFFGSRNITTGVWAFIGTISAGVLLTIFKDKIFLAFSIIFAVAILGRILSNRVTIKLDEPGYDPKGCEHFTLREFMEKAPKTNYGLFVKFVSLTELAINIARPFIAYYMIAILRMDYLTFAFIISVAILSSYVSTSFWGKRIDKYGSTKIMYLSALLLPITPIIWAFSTSLTMFVIAEIIAGFATAGFKMSSSIFILDCVKRNNTIKSTSYYNFFVGLATFAGGLIGYFAVKFLEPFFAIKTIIIALLLISAVAQLAITLKIGINIQETRFVRISFDKKPAFNPFKKEDAIVIKPACSEQ